MPVSSPARTILRNLPRGERGVRRSEPRIAGVEGGDTRTGRQPQRPHGDVRQLLARAFISTKKEGLDVGGQFLDGRAATLEEQAKGPFLNPLEMANPDKPAVVEKVRRAVYAPQFDSVFGKGALDDTELAYARIAEAVATFEADPAVQPFSSGSTTPGLQARRS